jgi:hypothetical protein
VLGVRVTAEQTRSAREIELAARAEEAEQRQADHYHGIYENRVLEPGDVDAAIAALDAKPPDPVRLRKRVSKWTGARLEALSRDHREAQGAVSLLAAVVEGELDPGRGLEIRGRRVDQRDAPELLAAEQSRLDELRKRLAKLDRDVFRWFWHKSAESPELRAELVERYRFLIGVQKRIMKLNALEDRLNAVMNVLGSGRELGEADVAAILDVFEQAHQALGRTLQRMRKVAMVQLSHLEAASSVAEFALEEPLIEAPELPIAGEWIGTFLRQYGQVLERLRRLHFKNLGVLLRLQETLDPELYGPETTSSTATTTAETTASAMPA